MAENEEEGLSNIEKAALILLSLGSDQAAKVMTHLSETEVKRLSRAFMGVQRVERDVQVSVNNEFRRMLQAADSLVVDGREFARDVISSAFGSDAGDTLLDYITGSKKEPLSTLLADIPANIADNFLQAEHPQTIAFLLSKMKPDQAAYMLGKMPEELQTEVLVRVSQLEYVKGDVVDDVREVVRSQLRGVSMREDDDLGGPKCAADILNFVERSNEERIITEIEELNGELAEEIRNLMFTFEDLKRLDDKGVQTLLKDLPRDRLVISMKTASDDLKGLIFRNMSTRAVAMLKEDLESLGPLKLKDVEKAQQEVIDVVRRLEGEGKLQISGGASDEVLV
ncbi:MAG: flagellar motor switch protein FliG [bacterium]|nr:flagellar motor switch protein FliG [bacterium]